MKRMFYNWVALSMTLGVAGPAKADYVFTSIDVPRSDYTFAQGINDSGQIVGTYEESGKYSHIYGFLLSGGGYTRLSVPFGGGDDTHALGINNSGQIVGSYTDAGGRTHGFLASRG